jgi:hypothetical protein
MAELRATTMTINSAVPAVGWAQLGHSNNVFCRGRDKYHCANAANDGHGNQQRPRQPTTAKATNDAVGISRSSYIKSYL